MSLRFLIVAGLFASLSFMLLDPALADGDIYTPDPDSPVADATLSVESNDDGVTIYIGITDTTPGSPGDDSPDDGIGGVDGDYGAWVCTADIMNIGQALLEWFMEESQNHPGEAPWIVRCNDEFIGVVWVPIDTEPPDVEIVVGPGGAIDPVTVAQELRDQVPIPEMTISANPDTGLVALPSWFWVDGYDGTPITASNTLGGLTVEVEITPQEYYWDFGDGGSLETLSLGQPYPAESDVRHTYQQSSLSTGAFTVTVEITFAARYRVNGSAWESLEPITRSFEDTYPVQQLQSVLTED
jgi:hypothetical protein